MKYKIEKNTVQETLIIPLYSRKLCSELYPNLYRDEMAVHLIDQIDYDFSQVEKKSHGLMQRFGSLEVAMRQNDLAWEVQNYLVDHPNAAVVNLGCGLDSTGSACDNGSCKIYNLDFPDVIAVRNQLLPAGDREENIPCNLNDTEWFTKIDASEAYAAIGGYKHSHCRMLLYYLFCTYNCSLLKRYILVEPWCFDHTLAVLLEITDSIPHCKAHTVHKAYLHSAAIIQTDSNRILWNKFRFSRHNSLSFA